jgi:hypothetical protein
MALGITVAAIALALAVTALLSAPWVARSRTWRAMVTPLASIIGSGFLICGPLLAKAFGSAAILAEVALLLIAYAVGATIRFNIAHVEPYLAEARPNDGVAWLARATQVVLSLAYAVSVAYYLKLLAEFALQASHIGAGQHALLSNSLVTAVIAAMSGIVLLGDLRRIEHVAHATVSLKLGVIAGMLGALAWSWIRGGPAEPPPPMVFKAGSVPVLLGLVITVQGFETSRYLGHAYDAQTRIRAMRYAQWLASAIYLLFLILLTPRLAPAARTPGVAGILAIMDGVAPFLGAVVLVGAVASQLSAAVADSIGAGGLMSEVSRRRLSVKAAFLAAAALATAVVWLTDPFQVVATASRAFALFYALQCGLALWVSRRTGAAGPGGQAAMALIGLLCLVAAAVGAPAE